MTCEAVLAEACYLLRDVPGAAAAVLENVRLGRFAVPFALGSEVAPVQQLLTRYADVPMDLADACLVRLAERFPDCRLFTLDSDFEHYRRNGRQIIPLLIPA